MDLLQLLDFFEPPVSIGFDVQPEKALEFFYAKGLHKSFSYADTSAEEHAVSFTVAKMMDMDLLADVKASLEAAMESGTPFKEWADNIIPTLQAKGWWGKDEAGNQLGSPHRLETIFRTNMAQAYAVGEWEQIRAQEEAAPFLMYDAVDDHRTRPEHAAWDGLILPVSHPFWRTHTPPNGWNSVVPDQRVSGVALLGLKAWYSGKVVEVVGKSGGRFTVTAQHPVLTTRGWVDAQALRKGDQLIAYRAPVVRGAAPADLHEDHAPPTIEQAYQALALGARASLPRATLYLNGDALFFEGDVEVVSLDRELLDHVQATAAEFVREIVLAGADQVARAEVRDGTSAAVLGGDGATVPMLGPVSRAPVAATAEGASLVDGSQHAALSQVSGDALPAAAEAARDLAGGRPGLVHLDHLLRDRLAQILARPAADLRRDQLATLRCGPYAHSGALDMDLGGFGVNPHAHRDLLQAEPRLVELDEVADLIFSDYTGHVYDLQTASGTMLAYGGDYLPQYVISNCRCSVIQLSEDEIDELGLQESPSPKVQTFKWRNPRTGKVEVIPQGIDPGFAYNPGQARLDKLKKLAEEKAAAMSADAAKAALKGIEEAVRASAAVTRQTIQAVRGAAKLSSATKAAERAAVVQIEKALAEKTPYLAKAIEQVKATKASKDMTATELLSVAKEKAVKAEQSALLARYKAQIIDGQEPSAKQRAAFDALPEEAQAAITEQINTRLAAAAAERAAEAEILRLVADTEGPAARALATMDLTGKTKAQVLAALKAAVARGSG